MPSFLVLVVGCAPAAAAPVPSTPEPSTSAPTAIVEAAPEEPNERLRAVEAHLLERTRRTRFRVDASGVLEASFVGTLAMDGDQIELAAGGNFAGQAVELTFVADGTRMRGTGGAKTFDLPQPPNLRDALSVGIVRMGILHTLAMLVAGHPPEVPEQGVRTWLVLRPQPGAEPVLVMPPHVEALPIDPITFRTDVDGKDSLVATVWIDEQRLVERQQETFFETGVMAVRESFSEF